MTSANAAHEFHGLGVRVDGATTPDSTALPSDLEAGPLILPDLGPILALHRHEHGVAFALRSDDLFLPRLKVPQANLVACFQAQRERMLKDSYVSINASDPDYVEGVGVNHSGETIRSLCACFSDCDFYHEGMTFESFLASVREWQDSGRILPPSAIVHSGRGGWLIWFLHDDQEASKSLIASSEAKANWAQVQAGIHERLTPLGADSRSLDAARYIRVPGSLRVETECAVQWFLQSGPGGPFSYHLRELSKAFRRAESPFPSTKPISAMRKVPSRRNGLRALSESRLQAFRELVRLRGGLKKGHRANAALILALILRDLGYSRTATEEEVLTLALSCQPPLKPLEARNQVRSVFKNGRTRLHRLRDVTISNWLCITKQEACSIPRFPPAGTRSPQKPAHLPMGQRREVRARELRIIVGASEETPSCRALTAILNRLGIRCSRSTVAADLARLGLMRANSGNNSC